VARRRRQIDSGGSRGEWLNTYADMVTLLLTFFIMLFSMSTLDSTKFNLMVKAFSDSTSEDMIVILGREGPNDFDGAKPQGPDPMEGEIEAKDLTDIFMAISQYIQQHNMQDSVQLSQGDGFIFIQFMDNLLFEPNSARLKPADLNLLNFVGMGIKSVQNQLQLVRIDGHTAAIPENPNYEVSDRLLSSERANSVLMYFEDVIGIRPELLVQMGYGKQVPLPGNTNSTDEERSKNRRVEIFISTENDLIEQLENIYEKLVE
jgi:chemotaxis protein MotB